MRIPILYQDPDLVVIDKPAGIPTHAVDPGDPYPGDALRIVQTQTGAAYLGMHQRLDADTSGVLLFAARREANRALAAAFEGRAVRKVYLALVHGAPPQGEGVIDAPIAREHGDRYRVTTPGDPRGLAARTRYRVVEQGLGTGEQGLGTGEQGLGTGEQGLGTGEQGLGIREQGLGIREQGLGTGGQESGVTNHALRNTQYAIRTTEYALRNTQYAIRTTEYAIRPPPPYTLLELTPETGRPHQIRVHLAYIGCPVVGDPLYGPADRPAPRLWLHAYQLTLPHPATGQPVTFTAPAPEALRGGCSAGDRPQQAIPGADSHAAPAATANESCHVPGTSQVPGTSGAIFSAAVCAHIRDAAAAPDAVRALLRLAVARRAPLAADPATTIYRLVNAAADGLPGLTADRYGDALVAAIYDDDDAVPPHPLPAALVELLAETTGARTIYVKYRPRQASRLADDQLAALAPSQPVHGPDLAEFVAHEEGLAYVIRPGEGLSTGLFPDMREGRARVRAWVRGRSGDAPLARSETGQSMARGMAGGPEPANVRSDGIEGRRVLNCFAYTCGFGVAATAGGAARVLNLDLSKSVLAWGQANYRANGFEPDPHDFVFGDVFDWLARLAKRGDRFDLVILDPPGFSRTRSGKFAAAQDYGALAGLAARVTVPGGLLLACCNVAELPWRSFRERVLAGMTAAGRTAAVRGVYHEPAIDFPTPMGGEPYLKMALLEVG